MSGGDGKGHNSGAHATGGVNGHSGKGGPSSGGVDASDHSGWSKENNPWGGGGTIGGDQHGNGGGTHSVGQSTTTLRPGESYMTPWGKVVADKDGHPTMNGTVMTEDNSSMVPDNYGGYTRVLNSLTFGVSGHEITGNNKTGPWIPTPSNPSSYSPPLGNKYRGSGFKSLDVRSVNGIGTYTIHLSSGGIMTVTVKNGDLNNMDVQFSHWHGSKSRERQFAKEVVTDYVHYKEIVNITADFYKEMTSKYSDKFSKEAKDLADYAKGKTLRNAKDAIKAFDKYKDVLNKKFSVADREAIAKALESLDKGEMAKQLAQFSKAFGLVGKTIQWGGFGAGLAKGFRTGNWNDAIISGEGIIAGKIASALVTVTFSMMAVNPIGIFGFAMIMAITSALITDKKLKEMNDFIMSL